jgi:hypothetical protein
VRHGRESSRAAAVAATALLVLPVCALAAPVAVAQSAPGLAISVPATAVLGTAVVGSGSVSGSLGPVTVTTAGGGVGTGGWTATVSTSGFTTGTGTGPERVEPASVRYRSGLATATSGVPLSACTPGSAVVPVDLSSPRTAFACAGISLLTATSVTWTPQVEVTLRDANVVGTYTGTIVHSVA